MEGQSLSAFFTLSGTAVVLLFMVVLWQRSILLRQSRSLEDASRAVAKKNSLGKEIILPLVDDAPFPLCFADTNGAIQKSSRSFTSLTGRKVATLNEFAQATGANLASTHKKTRHERVIIRTPGNDKLRHFSLVTWPVKAGTEVIGSMYALLEHTSAVQHASEHYHFQKEVLKLQAELIQSLEGNAHGATVQELEDLTEFLEASYTSKPQRTMEQFDLVKVVETALDEYRPHFRKQHIGVTATLPKQVKGIGFATESLEVVRLVLAGIAEHAPAHSTVRLHVARKSGKSVITVGLPGYGHHLASDEVFSFGKKSEQRSSRVRFALARVLMGYQHGTLHLTVDDENETQIELSFG